MPISISGGSAISAQAGAFRIVTKRTSHKDPGGAPFIELWQRGSATKQRPTSVSVMMWSLAGWMNKATVATVGEYPPAAGACFGTFTLHGQQIPEKLYMWRGDHQTSATYDYTQKNRYSGVNGTQSRDGANLLPNPGAQGYFHNQNMLAADGVSHNFSDFCAWDAVYNGGDGYFWPARQRVWNTDTPGSNGSIFGPGKTCSGSARYPASCGNAGTATERGALAHGVGEPRVLMPLGSMRPFATEVGPASGTADESTKGGDGAATLSLPSDVFGIAGGAPFTPKTSISLPGGNKPVNRNSGTSYEIVVVCLVELAR